MNVYVESNFVLELALRQEEFTSCERVLSLCEEDALIYSSVLSHLMRHGADQSCFLNRNSRDFDDQNVVDELRSYNCKVLPRFDSGCRFILNALRLS